MRLVDDWQYVLRHAHSLRWLAAAMILTGLEAAFPYFTEVFYLDPRWLSAIACILMGLAFASRLIAQKAFEDDGE